MSIIAISGKIGAGKDLTARFILEYLWSQSVNVQMIPCKNLSTNMLEESTMTYIKKFAFKVKLFASILLNVPIEKFEDQEFKQSQLGEEWSYMTVREFLIKLATEGLRDNLHKDVWINGLLSNYYDTQSKWIITDLRFINEFKALKKRGATCIRIERPDNNLKQVNHSSETELDGEVFDYVLINSGSIEDFRLEVFKMCKVLGL